MALFPLPVKAEISDTFAMPSRVLQFSSGASQADKDGLARPIEIWDIEVVFTSDSDNLLLETFLDTVRQHVVFQWQSPRDAAEQNYRIFGPVSSTKRNGGGSKPLFFSRYMRFKRVYG